MVVLSFSLLFLIEGVNSAGGTSVIQTDQITENILDNPVENPSENDLEKISKKSSSKMFKAKMYQ